MTNQQGAPEALRPIARYKIGYHTDEWGVRYSTPGGIADPSGQWVLYKDHLAALESHGQAPAQAAPAAVAGPADTFRGDTTCLVQNIIALLELDADGALVPHGIGGHARALLSAAASRLAAAPTTQPAPQREAQEPVAWRELCRRLYVELFYCDQQMTSGKRPKWQQGKTVRDVLADARAALDAARQPSSAAQGDALDAARYRYLTRSMGDYCVTYADENGGVVLKAAAADAAIDAARAAQEGKQ